jgi:hypothetical protein
VPQPPSLFHMVLLVSSSIVFSESSLKSCFSVTEAMRCINRTTFKFIRRQMS